MNTRALSLACLPLLAATPLLICAQTQSEMTASSDNALFATEATLTKLEDRISQRLDKEAQAQFTADQAAWRHYRDAHCNFLSSGSERGSVYPMLVMDCRNDLTKLRIKDLKKLLNCKDGDLSCPVPNHGT